MLRGCIPGFMPLHPHYETTFCKSLRNLTLLKKNTIAWRAILVRNMHMIYFIKFLPQGLGQLLWPSIFSLVPLVYAPDTQ